METLYWEIWYYSCEGNKRWAIAKAPENWSEYEVKQCILDNAGGIGDDVDEIISIHETYDHDYSWDYTQ